MRTKRMLKSEIGIFLFLTFFSISASVMSVSIMSIRVTLFLAGIYCVYGALCYGRELACERWHELAETASECERKMELRWKNKIITKPDS